MNSGRILTCVYCGHEYSQDTPSHGNQVLTDHIKLCEKHPLRAAESDIAMLRAALIGLVGAESENELKNFRAAMSLMPIPDAEKQVMLNAIAALQKTTGE